MSALRWASALLLVATAASAQPEEEASAHVERGMTRYDAGDYEQALAEFRAAYDLAPDPAVLYNLARVHERLDHPVEAVSFYERYLRDAGRLSRRERRAVERSLSALREQIGTVRIETNVEGAVISIGGVDRATTPLLDPIRVEAGRVEISARATGHDVARQEVSVAGGEEVLVRLTLRPLLERRGSIRVASNLLGVEVRIDGAFVGTTPMTPTHLASPGAHIVEGTRRGYLAARVEVRVEDAVETPVRLTLERDPSADASVLGTLALRTPQRPERVAVDGEALSSAEEYQLPIGAHEVEVVVPERRPVREVIELLPGATLRLQPEFQWTDAALATRRERAASQRLLGWVFLGAGAGLVVAGLVPVLMARRDLNSSANRARKDMLDFCELPENRGSLACSPDGPNGFDVALETERYNNLVDQTNLQRLVGSLGIGAGLALATSGTILVLLADSDRQIDDAANRASLRFGPTRASFELAF